MRSAWILALVIVGLAPLAGAQAPDGPTTTTPAPVTSTTPTVQEAPGTSLSGSAPMDAVLVPGDNATFVLRLAATADAAAPPAFNGLSDATARDPNGTLVAAYRLGLSARPLAGFDAPLREGEMRSLAVEVEVARGAPVANGTFALDVSGGDGRAFAAQVAFPIVAHGPRLTVTLTTPAGLALRPGGTGNVTLLVRNDGDLPTVLGTGSGTSPGFFTWEQREARPNATIPPGGAVEVRFEVVADRAAGPYDGPITFTISDGVSHTGSSIPLRIDPGAGGGAAELDGRLAMAGLGVVALGGIVALARTDAGRFGLGVATLPLYARLAGRDVLRNEARLGVYRHVSEHPGVRFESLRRETGLPNGVLVFHLRVLAREGYVSAHREGTRRRWYATGQAPPGGVGRPLADVVADILRRDPGLGLSEVARRLGVPRQLAQYHLRALERQRRVRSEGEGRARAWYAEDGHTGGSGVPAPDVPVQEKIPLVVFGLTSGGFNPSNPLV